MKVAFYGRGYTEDHRSVIIVIFSAHSANFREIVHMLPCLRFLFDT